MLDEPNAGELDCRPVSQPDGSGGTGERWTDLRVATRRRTMRAEEVGVLRSCVLPLCVACASTGSPSAPVDTDDTDDTDAELETDSGPPTDTGSPHTGCDTAGDASPLDLTRAVILPTAPQDGDTLRCVLGDEPLSDAWWGPLQGIHAAELTPDLTEDGDVWLCGPQQNWHLGGWSAYAAPVEADCAAIHVAPFRDDGGDYGPTLPYRAALSRNQRSFTIEAWFRPDRATGALGVLVTRDTRHTTSRQGVDYQLAVEADGRPSFSTGGPPDACTTLAAPDPTPIATWQHVAGTWDAATGEKQLFVDGRRVATCVTPERSTCSRAPVEIGLRTQSPHEQAFEGWIDDVRLSAGVRFTDDFAPSPRLTADATTRMLLRMDATLWIDSLVPLPAQWEVNDAGIDPRRFGGAVSMVWTDDLEPPSVAHSTCELATP